MPESNNSSQTTIIIFDTITKIAAICSVVLTIQISLANKDIERQLKELDSFQKKLQLNQDSISFDREFKFKIYQLALDAIKSNDSTQQEAAYIAVNTMMANTAFKTGLLNLFAKSKMVLPEIRKAATVATFDIKESKRPNPVYSTKNKIHIDVIYLEDSFRAKSVAQKVYNALQSSDYYECRIKPFPPERNKLPIYQINKNVIRYDADEKAKAEKLMQIVNQILPEGTEPLTIELTSKGKPTIQYISLFIIK